MQELYHFSCKVYDVGQELQIQDETYYHQKTKSKGTAWVDLYLDQHRPEGYPARARSLYAFGSLKHCLAYANSEICEGESKRYYKVEMRDPVSVPIVLTYILTKRGQNYLRRNEIAEEYWNPTEEWRFNEYLSIYMKIIEDVTTEGLDISKNRNPASLWYEDDRKLAKKIFPV